ncbi:unnamed protein product [Scytosiphon promiscuus]
MHIYPQRLSLVGLEVEIFKLVSFGAAPEQWAEWLRAPLEHAASRGDLDLVNRLLAAGANGGAGWKGCRGRTMLDAAALGGNAKVVSAFVRSGAAADINALTVSSRRSALYTATCCGHEEAARRLILAGADVNFYDPVDKCNILAKAVEAGHTQLVNDLLIRGALPNATDERGVTPLHVSAALGKEAILLALLLAGGNIDARDRDNRTPLIWAVVRGRSAAVRCLLAAGADCSIRQSDSYSALDLAAERGPIPILEAILQHGVDVNAQDPGGCAPLHTAALRDQGDAIRALVKAGADTELRANGGWTPLHAAARHRRCKAMEALLENKAAVNARFTQSGRTPLHRVCRDQLSGMGAAVGILLKWGADETATDNEGLTPEDVLGPTRENNPRCSPGEVERTRRLLKRAPADRSWRRRGWLVMLRLRADGGTRATSIRRARGSGVMNASCGGAGVPQEDQGFKMPRGESANCGGGSSGAGDLGTTVALLVGLDPEAVFRAVLGFL